MEYEIFIKSKNCGESVKTAFRNIFTNHSDVYELKNIFAKSQGFRWNSGIERENESASIQLCKKIAQIVNQQKGLNLFEKRQLASIIRDYLTEQRMKQPNEEEYYNVK